MWQPVEWVLELILSPAFHLMCLMFLAIGLVGLLEWLLPAHDIPSQHYGLNLCYAVVNGVAIAAATPFISGVTARVIQSVGLGLIDLPGLGFDGVTGGLIAVLVWTLVLHFFQSWEHRDFHSSTILCQH